jgi:CheY-like chemotaxis protein
MQSQRTVDYSALERTCGSEKGDPRSDIYFLGCVFYQMITGQAPMKESESKDMLQKMLVRSFGAIVPLSEHRLAPDPPLSRVIEKMMKVELKARYQNMDDVISDLSGYEGRVRAGITGFDDQHEEDTEYLDDLDAIFTHRPGSAEAGDARPGTPNQGAERKSLLCVENQQEIQEAMRKSLTKLGYRVILVGDAELAAERYDEARPDGVIFDIDGLGQEGIDALISMNEKAREDGHDLAALVLLGRRQGELREQLPADARLGVLVKPVKMKQVQQAIQQLLPVT